MVRPPSPSHPHLPHNRAPPPPPQICCTVQSAIQITLVAVFSYGKPKTAIPIDLQTSAWPLKLIYINQILFKLTTPLCKLSLCLLYLAIFSTCTSRLIRRTRMAIRATIAPILGAYASAFLVSIFQCTPIRRTRDKSVPGKCINLRAFRMSTSVFNVVTSLLVIGIPIPALARLKKHRPEVKQLLALILLGLVHTGLTITRFVIMSYPDPLTKTEPQYTHVFTNALAMVEMHTGILVATLVVMRPAFQATAGAFCLRKRARDGMVGYVGQSSGEGEVLWDRRACGEGSGRERAQSGVLETTHPHVGSEVTMSDVSGPK